MKNLKGINISRIKETVSYFLFTETYERYGAGDVNFMYGTGLELINELKQLFSYDEWLEDENHSDNALSVRKFLSYVNECNGDGEDYVQIFSIPNIKTIKS